jgi:MFS family permease
MLILLIPLLLASFTHLWNPIGFPWIHEDEGHYMRRAMHTLQGLGPQETTSDFDHPFDHPYFGQLFLSSVLKIIGYLDALPQSSSNDELSIGMFYFAPRLLIGVLAIIDTFLVYKIAERRYNLRVALIASTLFAVMPLSLLLRGVFLDNILLPFLLLSILFAVYGNTDKKQLHNPNGKFLLVVLSGIFFGLSIFTKSPAFTLAPLIGYIIYVGNNKNLRLFALWLIPIAIISAVWPINGILSGQFDEWLEGVIWQAAQRPEKPLSNALVEVTQMDPIFTVLAFAGLIYATLLEVHSRRFFITLWLIPYIMFLYAIGWVSYFHWIILLPGFSISGAAMMNDLIRRIGRGSALRYLLSNTIFISAIAIIGLTFSIMLITMNVTSSYFDLYSFVVRYLTDNSQDGKTIVGHRWTWAFTWIPHYAFGETVYFEHFNSTAQIKTDKFLLLVDNYVKRHLSNNDIHSKLNLAHTLYNNSHAINRIKDESISHDGDLYPYTFMSQNRGIGRYSPVEIRANY